MVWGTIHTTLAPIQWSLKLLVKSSCTKYSPFSYVVIFLRSRFTAIMISIDSPSNFINTSYLLPLGDKVARRYAPGASYITMSLPSYASINNVVIKDSNAVVGEATNLPCFQCFFCSLPFAHIMPFMSLLRHLLIKFTAFKAFVFLISIIVSICKSDMTDFTGVSPLFSCITLLSL